MLPIESTRQTLLLEMAIQDNIRCFEKGLELIHTAYWELGCNGTPLKLRSL